MIKFGMKDKPTHPIVKALNKYESHIWKPTDQIIYSPTFDSTCGWHIEGHFLGFTKDEVVATLERTYNK